MIDNQLKFKSKYFFLSELERVGKENPGLVSNVRGYGLHLGFDSNRAESL